jgi:hypothetical protein
MKVVTYETRGSRHATEPTCELRFVRQDKRLVLQQAFREWDEFEPGDGMEWAYVMGSERKTWRDVPLAEGV